MHDAGEFERVFFDPRARWTWIGTGAIGGKASGLVAIDDILSSEFAAGRIPDLEISIPTFTVIRTDVFDTFIASNNLRHIIEDPPPDDVIAQNIQKATLPAEILGDLRAVVDQVRTPLAVRSSSLLEDSMRQPFAGIYTTKMIPNNQPAADTRFQKLVEAIKLVYASTFFSAARDYILASGRSPAEEKMAVVIQEVVGRRYGERFYPQVSAVARSYDFYPVGRARREDGVANLALGLGKTIVDGGQCWSYSPSRPTVAPPFNSFNEMLERTQTEFWAVNMGKPPAYDPIHETEYLVHASLADAEQDGTLGRCASTYDGNSDRLIEGTARSGPRVLNFSGLLAHRDIPFNETVGRLLSACKKAVGYPVEIELAATFDPLKIGFLQVRPMAVSGEEVVVAEEELTGSDVLVASDRVMGNGAVGGVTEIVYVRPECFDAKLTPRIARELETINRQILEAKRTYLLIGFGRWGSSDPWLGIPVNWGQISGARAIVEAAGSSMNVEMSQGSHFFHNLVSFSVSYFGVPAEARQAIDWNWLDGQKIVAGTDLVRHVTLSSPLDIRVDGRTGRGVIRKTVTKDAR